MTDFITVSRKEIEALQRWQDDEEIANNCYEDDDGCFILYDDLRALLDKAEVIEPVGMKLPCDAYNSVGYDKKGGQYIWWRDVPMGAHLFITPPDQIAKIVELEAEIARLNAIIEDMKVIDNVFGKCK